MLRSEGALRAQSIEGLSVTFRRSIKSPVCRGSECYVQLLKFGITSNNSYQTTVKLGRGLHKLKNYYTDTLN